jgi:DNA-binding transcriptional LysR family regulator
LLKENKVSPKLIEFSCNQSLRNCLLRGIGITICPSIAVKQDLESGHLQCLPCQGFIPEAAIFMIHHADKWHSPLLKTFKDIARRKIKKMQGEADRIWSQLTS